MVLLIEARRFSRVSKVFQLLMAMVSGVTFASSVNAQTDNQGLVIGAVPNMSARVVIAQYQPVRDYFQRTLKQSVEIVTSTDFPSFSRETLKGSYSLVFTPANLGRVAQVDGGWSVLACLEPGIPAVLVGMADNPNSNPSQLSGKSLATTNPSSLVVQAGLRWLKERKLEVGRDYKLSMVSNDDSLFAVLRSGEAPFAMMSKGEFLAKPEPMRQSTRIVSEMATVSGFWIMTNPKMPVAQRQRIKELLLAFPDSEEGKLFFASPGRSGLSAVTDAEMKELDPYLEATRKALAP
jgi:phosphonate transport system substrate-binding protein